jgi:hypothetical protein
MFSPEHATDFPDLNFCKVSNNIGIKYNWQAEFLLFQ